MESVQTDLALLSAVMAYRNVTLDDIAKTLGIVPSVLSDKLEGKRTLYLSEIIQINKMLEINSAVSSAIFLPDPNEKLVVSLVKYPARSQAY
jgi:antitoxin component HigA of HigAB toxin-antitoxin module